MVAVPFNGAQLVLATSPERIREVMTCGDQGDARAQEGGDGEWDFGGSTEDNDSSADNRECDGHLGSLGWTGVAAREPHEAGGH
jgi:hypothetical protein